MDCEISLTTSWTVNLSILTLNVHLPWDDTYPRNKTDCSIHNPVNATQNVLELVFHYLLENPNYPKIDRKGKWTRTEDDEEGACRPPVPKIDYGVMYQECKEGIHYFN
ncbi:hypothetical protein BDR04DRAFT_1151790 [Suillus decipiens]|nr:hypothetical protein BDR04DRAFT_1151790 [Suillus decipiens]